MADMRHHRRITDEYFAELGLIGVEGSQTLPGSFAFPLSYDLNIENSSSAFPYNQHHTTQTNWPEPFSFQSDTLAVTFDDQPVEAHQSARNIWEVEYGPAINDSTGLSNTLKDVFPRQPYSPVVVNQAIGDSCGTGWLHVVDQAASGLLNKEGLFIGFGIYKFGSDGLQTDTSSQRSTFNTSYYSYDRRKLKSFHAN
jgi:hypothetical protein